MLYIISHFLKSYNIYVHFFTQKIDLFNIFTFSDFYDIIFPYFKPFVRLNKKRRFHTMDMNTFLSELPINSLKGIAKHSTSGEAHDILVNHPNPYVRIELAENTSIRRLIISILCTDKDSRVAQTIANRQSLNLKDLQTIFNNHKNAPNVLAKIVRHKEVSEELLLEIEEISQTFNSQNAKLLQRALRKRDK